MRFPKFAWVLGLVFLAFCLGSGVRAEVPADVVFLKGKSLGLRPPPDFEPSKTFSGFVEAKTGNTILLLQLPAGVYPKVLVGLSPEGLAKQDIAMDARQDVEIDGQKGIVIKGTQTVDGKPVKKWILLLDTDQGTMLLTAQELKPGTLGDAAVMAAFESIRVREGESLEAQIKKLPFDVDELAGFRIVRTFSGTGMLLTKGPQNIVTDGSQPVVMIQRPMKQPFPTSMFPGELADRLLRSVHSISLTSVSKTVDREVAGAEGYETVASARDVSLDRPLAVVQWLRLESGRQVHVLAILPDEERKELLPDLRKLVAALRLR